MKVPCKKTEDEARKETEEDRIVRQAIMDNTLDTYKLVYDNYVITLYERIMQLHHLLETGKPDNVTTEKSFIVQKKAATLDDMRIQGNTMDEKKIFLQDEIKKVNRARKLIFKHLQPKLDQERKQDPKLPLKVADISLEVQNSLTPVQYNAVVAVVGGAKKNIGTTFGSWEKETDDLLKNVFDAFNKKIAEHYDVNSLKDVYELILLTELQHVLDLGVKGNIQISSCRVSDDDPDNEPMMDQVSCITKLDVGRRVVISMMQMNLDKKGKQARDLHLDLNIGLPGEVFKDRRFGDWVMSPGPGPLFRYEKELERLAKEMFTMADVPFEPFRQKVTATVKLNTEPWMPIFDRKEAEKKSEELVKVRQSFKQTATAKQPPQVAGKSTTQKSHVVQPKIPAATTSFHTSSSSVPPHSSGKKPSPPTIKKRSAESDDDDDGKTTQRRRPKDKKVLPDELLYLFIFIVVCLIGYFWCQSRGTGTDPQRRPRKRTKDDSDTESDSDDD